MAQTASLLAVATVFIGLWTLIFTFYSLGGGAYTRLALFIHEITSAKRTCEVWPVLLVQHISIHSIHLYIDNRGGRRNWKRCTVLWAHA